MIFIAYNYSGAVIDVIRARSEELAMAFLQGKGSIPHRLVNVDDPEVFTPLEEHPTGVHSIVKVEVMSGSDLLEATNIGRSGRNAKFFITGRER